MRTLTPPPAKFFFAITLLEKGYHAAAEEAIAERWGAIDLHSELYCFSDYTHYYEAEMGRPLWKYFLTLERPLAMDSLVEVKFFAEDLQTRFARVAEPQLRRTINLDPGYITSWNLVLSTVKNFAHRIYLRDGIYAEVTLVFKERRFQTLPWTYTDYASPLALDFFTQARKVLLGSRP